RRATQSLVPGDDVARPGGPEPLTWAEVRQALDEELGRLPEHYRAALVLCYLEGRPRDEAALQLGWSLPALHGRLERGRALLHARLVRRGLTLSAALVAGALAQGRATALPARLALQIIRSATPPRGPPPPSPPRPPLKSIRPAPAGAAVSPHVAALLHGALTIMTRLKKKHVALAFAAFLTIAGYAAYRVCMAESAAQAWTSAL